MNVPNVPKKAVCCKSEFAEFKVLMTKALKHRGKHRQRCLEEIDEFFCDKLYEIMMRQRGYFKELLDSKSELERRIHSLQNELSSLECKNHDLRQKLTQKDVFSHSLSSSGENAS